MLAIEATVFTSWTAASKVFAPLHHSTVWRFLRDASQKQYERTACVFDLCKKNGVLSAIWSLHPINTRSACTTTSTYCTSGSNPQSQEKCLSFCPLTQHYQRWQSQICTRTAIWSCRSSNITSSNCVARFLDTSENTIKAQIWSSCR